MQKFQPVSSIPADSSEMSAKLTSQERLDTPKIQMTSCKSAAMIGIALSVGATGAFWGINAEPVAAETIYPQYSSANFQEAETSNPKTVSLGTPVLKHTVKTGETVWRIARSYKVKPEAIATDDRLDNRPELNSNPSFFVPNQKTFTEPTIAESREKVVPVLETSDSESIATKVKSSVEDDRVESVRAQTNLDSLTAELERENPSLKQNEDPALDRLKDNLAKLRLQQDRNNIASTVIPSEVKTTELKEPQIISQAVPVNEIDSEGVNNQDATTLTEEKTALTVKTNEATNSGQPIIIPVPAPETGIDSNSSVVSPLTTETTTASNTQKDNSDNATTEIYQIRVGDTLSSIARRYGISRDELMAANGIDDPNKISIGQSLTVPVNSTGTTKNNSETTVTVNRPSQLLVNNTTAIDDRNNLVSENKIGENDNNPVTSQTQTTTPTEEDSHLDKLTADIQRIRQEYQTENQNDKDPVTLANQQPIEIEVPTVTTPTVTKNYQGQDNYADDENQKTNLNRRQPENQIATNSGNGSNYNPSLQTPVGTQVEPDLPPLSSPEEYLPNNSTTVKAFIWPAKGVLTSGFGRRWGRMHKGIDIGAPIGTPIMAVAGGEVITAGWNSGGFGNLVKIEHPDGTITLYAHNNRVLVRKGQIVQQGEQISELGNTGRSTGPHLHFEVHPNGQAAVNPIAFLPKKK
jgi:murein DD-endopeptidase MepM/ murein hydrolase activator NlpD